MMMMQQGKQLAKTATRVARRRAASASAAYFSAQPAMSHSERAIALEEQYGAHNYHPLPVVLCEGKNTKVFDVEGREYYDVRSVIGAVAFLDKVVTGDEDVSLAGLHL